MDRGELVERVKRLCAQQCSTEEAYSAAWDVCLCEFGDSWTASSSTATVGNSRMGTIAVDAVHCLVRAMKDHAVFYDIGAGYGLVIFTMKILGFQVHGCEFDKSYCESVNTVGREYFGESWHDVEFEDFKQASLPDASCLVYVNNIAFRQDETWLVAGLQRWLRTKSLKIAVYATHIVSGLEGSCFRERGTEGPFNAIHGSGDATFSFSIYAPDPSVAMCLSKAATDSYSVTVDNDEMQRIVAACQKWGKKNGPFTIGELYSMATSAFSITIQNALKGIAHEVEHVDLMIGLLDGSSIVPFASEHALLVVGGDDGVVVKMGTSTVTLTAGCGVVVKPGVAIKIAASEVIPATDPVTVLMSVLRLPRSSVDTVEAEAEPVNEVAEGRTDNLAGDGIAAAAITDDTGVDTEQDIQAPPDVANQQSTEEHIEEHIEEHSEGGAAVAPARSLSEEPTEGCAAASAEPTEGAAAGAVNTNDNSEDMICTSCGEDIQTFFQKVTVTKEHVKFWKRSGHRCFRCTDVTDYKHHHVQKPCFCARTWNDCICCFCGNGASAQECACGSGAVGDRSASEQLAWRQAHKFYRPFDFTKKKKAKYAAKPQLGVESKSHIKAMTAQEKKKKGKYV